MTQKVINTCSTCINSSSGIHGETECLLKPLWTDKVSGRTYYQSAEKNRRRSIFDSDRCGPEGKNWSSRNPNIFPLPSPYRTSKFDMDRWILDELGQPSQPAVLDVRALPSLSSRKSKVEEKLMSECGFSKEEANELTNEIADIILWKNQNP